MIFRAGNNKNVAIFGDLSFNPQHQPLADHIVSRQHRVKNLKPLVPILINIIFVVADQKVNMTNPARHADKRIGQLFLRQTILSKINLCLLFPGLDKNLPLFAADNIAELRRLSYLNDRINDLGGDPAVGKTLILTE